MEIERIRIEHYRGKDFDLCPKKLNIFLGMNGAGKTSLCDAIRFGITGMASEGINNTSVRILYKNGMDTERLRSKSNTYRINGKRVTEEALNLAVADAAGLPVPHIDNADEKRPRKRTDPLECVKIISSSQVLLHLKPGELSSFLLKYIPERLNYEIVMNYFSKMSEEINVECSLFFPAMPEEFGIEEIQAAYHYFYEERTVARRVLRGMEAELSRLHPTKPARTMDLIEQDLTSILIRENQSKTVREQINKYEEEKRKRQTQDERIKKLEGQLPKTVPQTPRMGELETIEASRSKAEKEKSELALKMQVIQDNLELFQRTLESLDQPVCPISSRLTCSTDKSEVREEIEKSIKDNKRLYGLYQTDIRTMEELIQNCIERRKKYDEQKERFDQYESLVAQIKLCKENLTDIPDKPEASVQEEDTAKEKRKLMDEKKNLEDFRKKQDLTKDVERYRERIGRYDYLISALEDKGEVKSGIMERYLSMFTKTCNLRAASFAPGYELKFIQEDGVRIRMKTPASKDFCPVESLSSGETIIAVCLITDLLNQLSNSRLLFLDNVEALDAGALGNLRRMMEQPDFLDSYDHIFICGVNHIDVQKAFQDMDAQYLSD